jgi:hypothetical protein
MNWYTIVSTVAIPFIVQLLKAMKLPSKWAPLAAFGVAGLLVGLGKVFGVEMNVNDMATAILTALATAGVGVLGYDTVRTLTK